MPGSRIAAGVLAVGAVFLATAFGVGPASAATLPAGQQITLIDTFEGTSTMFDAAPADATVVPIGAGQAIQEFITGIDVDDTGHGYAIGNWSDGDGSGATLFVADATTGALTSPQVILIALGEDPVGADDCQALDYSGGVLTAVCSLFSNGFAQYYGIIDPATGEFTVLIELVEDPQVYAIALDPTTGITYAIAQPDGWALYTLDDSAGLSFLSSLELPGYGADFDSGGQLWATSSIWVPDPGSEFEEEVSALKTVSLADFSVASVDMTITAAAENFAAPFIEPITVWGAGDTPTPLLPATGPGPDAPLLVGAAAMLLLSGVILARLAVRRRSTH